MKAALPLTAYLIAPLLAYPAFAQCPPHQSPAAQASGKQAPDTSVPKIYVLRNQRMLALSRMGDPDKVGDSAMADLLRIFFRYAGEAEKNTPVTPRVRWFTGGASAARKDWIGKYALPVSETFPDIKVGGAAVEEWHYGLTAEILHGGPYADEAKSIARLQEYLRRYGYLVVGDLEEEYVQGRGTLYQGYPQQYRTLLRFPVAQIQDLPREATPLSALP